ncbi:MAG: DUF4810 domain-containing protein [Candidatus Cloacimonetes bacterium]|nr:DUF4810 domain-containing protein [Candidatus Cloacimonadota bacterium]
MKKILLPLLLALIMLTGCVATTPYYWGYYSYSLYQYKKSPGEETLIKHKNNIEKIFRKTEAGKKQVPPGIYCEYGYYLIEEGKITEGLEYFDKEVRLYPESAKFIETMRAQLAKGDSNE